MTRLYPAQSFQMRPVATGLSLITAVTYFIIAFGLVPEGFKSPPGPVMFAAGLAYLVGGVLILQVKKRLLRLGVVLNALVLFAFVMAVITGNATVDALGLTGKAAQVGLEMTLMSILMKRTPAG